jgi:arylmalonate decarboxylase
MTHKPKKLGIIFPPAGRGVPEEGLAIFGDRVEYLIENLGLEQLTPEGYGSVLDRIGPCTDSLVARGAEAILLTGTSLTFYQGEEKHQQLLHLVRERSRLPATSMSQAMLDSFVAIGARKLLVATAYNDEVNSRLRVWLESLGYEITHLQGMNLEAIEDIEAINQDRTYQFCLQVAKHKADAECLFISCGGLRTLELLDPLQEAIGLPVISSMPHTLMAAEKLLNLA